ncbi:MAG: TIGR00296 family protein [Nitrososphaerales archaeon]
MQGKRTLRIFTDSDGQLLIGSSRESISTFLGTGKLRIPQRIAEDVRFEEKIGCFVTLRENDHEKTLRGCVGFPQPVLKLFRALPEASIAAATQDPRFPRLQLGELEKVLIEISILSEPRLVSVKSQKELPNEIRIGTDGLMMKWDFGSGLLLPQVATEFGWNAEEFLCNLSVKTGAPPDQWLVPGTQIFRFQAMIFSEDAPNGKVTCHHRK